MKKINIYDCFIFFNELEMLNLRLNELYDAVDYFIIVESTHTFSGNEKPLIFKENIDKFSAFLSKIHYYVTTPPNTQYNKGDEASARTNESWQRDQIKQGLANCNNDDIIIVSDLDEIPRKTVIQNLAETIQRDRIYVVREPIYYYYINYYGLTYGGTVISTFKRMKENTLKGEKTWSGMVMDEYSPQYLRDYMWKNTKDPDGSVIFIDNGGWHFSWIFGKDTNKIRTKIESFCNQAINNDEDINRCITNPDRMLDVLERKLTRVPVDDSYPEYIRNNIKYFEGLEWIKN